jgi:hypothetical protein
VLVHNSAKCVKQLNKTPGKGNTSGISKAMRSTKVKEKIFMNNIDDVNKLPKSRRKNTDVRNNVNKGLDYIKKAE